jgi:hypothetical protein
MEKEQTDRGRKMRVKNCPTEYCFECDFCIKSTGACTKPWEDDSLSSGNKSEVKAIE